MVLEHSTTVLKSEKIKGDPKTTVSEIMDRCKLVQYMLPLYHKFTNVLVGFFIDNFSISLLI